MRALFDVNVLLALLDPAHIHHRTARLWVQAHEEDGWASCPITQNGFLRIVSGRGYPNPVSMTDASDALEMQLGLPGHEFWPDSISLLDDALFDRRYFIRPERLTDIYLLGLAVKRAGRLVTFDRGISFPAVYGATPENLESLG